MMNRLKMLRRLRGVLGTALTWAVIWMPLGVVMGLIRESAVYCLYCDPNWFVEFLLFWTLWGALSGALFATVLMLAERRRSFSELTSGRTAIWGALGAVVLPAALMIRDAVQYGVQSSGLIDWFTVLVLAVAAGLGALCAVGTLRIARHSLAH